MAGSLPYWLDFDVAGFLAAVAAGFCLYAVMLVHAVVSVKVPMVQLRLLNRSDHDADSCAVRFGMSGVDQEQTKLEATMRGRPQSVLT